MTIETSQDCDCHGQPLCGSDGDGAWVGTENAFYVLGSEEFPRDVFAPRLWAVSGYIGSVTFIGLFVADNEADGYRYAAGFGCKDILVLGGASLREERPDVGAFVHFTNEEAWCSECRDHVTECMCWAREIERQARIRAQKEEAARIDYIDRMCAAVPVSADN